jgi:alpha-L-fucosidase 2
MILKALREIYTRYSRIHCVRVFALAMVGLALPGAQGLATTPDLAIWFDRPGDDWEREGLPIGNGAMGAVILGQPDLDVIQFNEKTLWTGGPGAKGGYDFGLPPRNRTSALAGVRRTIEREGAMSPEAVIATLARR